MQIFFIFLKMLKKKEKNDNKTDSTFLSCPNRKISIARGKTACYLHKLANGAQCHGRSLSLVPQWLRKGKYIFRATVWFNCWEVNLAQTACIWQFLVIIVLWVNIRWQKTSGKKTSFGAKRGKKDKRNNSSFHSHKYIAFRLILQSQMQQALNILGHHST